MRQLVLQMWVSIDGYSCDEDTEFYRMMDELGADDDELDAYIIDTLRRAGTLVMGRLAYQSMVNFWPAAVGPAAERMNEISKVVFSSTLERAEWWGSRVARGELAEEIMRLKHEAGGDILAHGGPRFSRSLIELGLVDVYRLIVLPIAAGTGAGLFSGIARPEVMRLVASEHFPSGVLALTYRPQ